MIVWAAIDLLDGRAVRLEQGREGRRTDFGPATAVFEELASLGIGAFHVVDLDAAFGRPPTLPAFLRSIRPTAARLQVAGGIRSMDSARKMIDLGAERIVLGSLLHRDPETTARLVSLLGPDRCVAAVDVRGEQVRIEGWKSAAGTIPASLRAAREFGFAEALVTDIDRDGMMRGPNLPLTRRLSGAGLRIVASGGITSPRHLRALASMAHVSGAVVGKALHLRRLRPREILEYAS